MHGSLSAMITHPVAAKYGKITALEEGSCFILYVFMNDWQIIIFLLIRFNRHNLVHQSDRSHQSFVSGHAEVGVDIYAHDMFEPSWNCESKSRVPSWSGEMKNTGSAVACCFVSLVG